MMQQMVFFEHLTIICMMCNLRIYDVVAMLLITSPASVLCTKHVLKRPEK